MRELSTAWDMALPLALLVSLSSGGSDDARVESEGQSQHEGALAAVRMIIHNGVIIVNNN